MRGWLTRARAQLKPLRADLHGTIFVVCDNGLRQPHDMIYDCCVCQKICRSTLKHVLKRYDNRKSCLRPVASLSRMGMGRFHRPVFSKKAIYVGFKAQGNAYRCHGNVILEENVL